jgi:hypothetical protein
MSQFPILRKERQRPRSSTWKRRGRATFGSEEPVDRRARSLLRSGRSVVRRFAASCRTTPSERNPRGCRSGRFAAVGCNGVGPRKAGGCTDARRLTGPPSSSMTIPVSAMGSSAVSAGGARGGRRVDRKRALFFLQRGSSRGHSPRSYAGHGWDFVKALEANPRCLRF